MYQSIILPYFHRQLKHYTKKYRRLKEDVISAIENFKKEQHTHLGNNVYKIRLKGQDLPRGKSKSFRLIVLLIEKEKFIVPITVYFKGKQEDITKKELNDCLEIILFELKVQKLFTR